MKIIIIGAGQVGSSLAENLAHENHDIVVIDRDAARLSLIQDRLDISTINGFGSYPGILRQAGAKEADMLIAVTDSDEVNMVACQVAYSLFQVPKKIARIRSRHYFISQELFGSEHMPIDIFISPEQLVTHAIKELIVYPAALQVLSFANNKVKLVAVRPYPGLPLLGKPLKTLHEHIDGVDFRIAAIYRNNQSIPLDGETCIEIGDEVFFIAASENISTVIASMHRSEAPYQRVMIAGGGHIGFGLAKSLQEDYQVKVIERNIERCELIAEHIHDVTVLQGDATEKDLLISENIEDMDVFVAVTNDDEANIMSCMLAKNLGARRVIALVARPSYVDLIEDSGIDLAISPQQITSSGILKYVRAGDVVNVHALRRGAAEAIEAIARGGAGASSVVGLTLAEIKLPRATTIGAIVRQDEVIIPHHDTRLETGDHVVLFVADKKHIREVEKLFLVK